jgi:hypothetical protein
VAQSAQPTAQRQRGGRHHAAGALHHRPTTDRWAPSDPPGRLSGFGRMADASIPNAPGARKPHAGICARAVG